jgi:hypothetical protein
MELTEKQLLDKKAEIEKNKETHSRLQTEYRTMLKQLKEDFGFATLAEARTELERLEAEQKELDVQIAEKTEEVYNLYFKKDTDDDD